MSLFQPVGRLPRVCGAPPCPEYHDGYVTSSTALEKIVSTYRRSGPSVSGNAAGFVRGSPSTDGRDPPCRSVRGHGSVRSFSAGRREVGV